jgi:acetyl esterase/lipase
LILQGTADKTVPVEQSQSLADSLKKAGVRHELIVIEDGPHSFHLQPKQRDLRPVVLGFFDRYLKPSAANEAVTCNGARGLPRWTAPIKRPFLRRARR